MSRTLTTNNSVISDVPRVTLVLSSLRNGSLVCLSFCFSSLRLSLIIRSLLVSGHPKGGAAAWMLNGIAQTIQSGLIPGNRYVSKIFDSFSSNSGLTSRVLFHSNADNISQELRAFEYLLYPSKSIQTDGIKAGLLTSFGFGQVGGQALIIHPEYLLGSLEPSTFDSYKELNEVRRKGSYRRFNDVRLTLFTFNLCTFLLTFATILYSSSLLANSSSSRKVLLTILSSKLPFSSTLSLVRRTTSRMDRSRCPRSSLLRPTLPTKLRTPPSLRS